MLQADAPREVWLRPSSLTPSALRSLAAFLYTDRLDAPVEDAEVLVRAVRVASCARSASSAGCLTIAICSSWKGAAACYDCCWLFRRGTPHGHPTLFNFFGCMSCAYATTPVQARRLGLHDAAKAFAAERRTLQYYFKSTRPNDAVPRRCARHVLERPSRA